MAVYIYDGSFDGFLTCIYNHYYKEKAHNIKSEFEYLENIIDKTENVSTDINKAQRVYQAIEEKISINDLRRIYRVFKSSGYDKEIILLRYIELGFKIGSRVSMNHSNPVVKSVEVLDYKVLREIERMLGLTRFSSSPEGVLFSRIKTDHDVLEFIADHFSKRLNSERFIILDGERQKAIFAANGDWYIRKIDYHVNLDNVNEEEELYRSLWRNYYKSLAIKERKNEKCQTNMMPKRYWENLIEMT